jgi:hypothetical protein
LTDWVKAAVAKAEAQFKPPPEGADETVPGRVALVDGDYLAYFASGGDNMPMNASRQVVLNRLNAVKEISGAERVELHLTHRGSTKGDRFLIAETQPYQGQRNKSRRPKNWEGVREFMENLDFSITPYSFVKRVSWTDREADDGFALAARTSLDPVREVVLHYSDKDMRMLPGTHLTWEYETVRVPKNTWEVLDSEGRVYGDKWFWMQMIQGDAADHILGIPGDGKVAAQERLADVFGNARAGREVFAAYVDHYGDQRIAADKFVENAALLFLRQANTPYDFWRMSIPSMWVLDATYRMVQRVKEQREALDRIADQT